MYIAREIGSFLRVLYIVILILYLQKQNENKMGKIKMFLLLMVSSLLFAACASHHCHNRYGRYKHSEVIVKTEKMQENA